MNFENEEYGLGYGYGHRARGMGMRHAGMHGMHERGYRYGFGLKYFILALASKQQIRGADVMNSIEQLSHGYWRPSPGHVYFELDRLVDEGYLERSESEEGKYYKITDKGKQVMKDIEEWFPISSLLGQASKEASAKADKSELKEKLLNEIKALESAGSLSEEQKRHLATLKDLVKELD